MVMTDVGLVPPLVVGAALTGPAVAEAVELEAAASPVSGVKGSEAPAGTRSGVDDAEGLGVACADPRPAAPGTAAEAVAAPEEVFKTSNITALNSAGAAKNAPMTRLSELVNTRLTPVV